MVKIMLVEDDKSLREIYGARLLAEGYDIVSAGDGEEALAIAIKEKPGLIISDVMMPKISGFDMLDILRSSSETRNVKVIMMTALSSDDQRQRGEQLGADRYLVKSQVGIEDVVRVVHEVLEDTGEAASNTAPAPVQQSTPSTDSADKTETPANENSGSEPQPEKEQSVPAAEPTPPTEEKSTENEAEPSSSKTDENTSSSDEETVAETSPSPSASSEQNSNSASGRNNIIQPLNDPMKNNIDINALLDKEMAKEAGVNADNLSTNPSGAEDAATTEQERGAMEEQINQFANTPNQSASADNSAAEQPSQPANEPSQQSEIASPDTTNVAPNETAPESSEQNQTNDNSDQTPPSAPPPPPRPPVAL